MLLEDTQSNNFLVWPVDQNWQHNGSQSVVKPNSSKARSLEERFAIDLTNDGLLGNFRVINTSRPFDLLVNIATNQYYIRENSKNSSKQAVQSLQRLGFKGPQIRQSDSLPLSV